MTDWEKERGERRLNADSENERRERGKENDRSRKRHKESYTAV